MDDLTWIAPTLVALFSGVAALVAASRSKDNGKRIEEVAVGSANSVKKVEEVAEKVEQIHATTNGTLSAANAAKEAATSAKDVLTERLTALELRFSELQTSSSLAAHLAEQSATDVRVAQSMIPPKEEDC